jgi:hypothetical protein
VNIDPIFSINNITSSTLTTTKLTFEITRTTTLEKTILPLKFFSHYYLTNALLRYFFTFNNKNNFVNNSYSNIGIPCRRMCKIKVNPIFFFKPPNETQTTLRSWQISSCAHKRFSHFCNLLCIDYNNNPQWECLM